MANSQAKEQLKKKAFELIELIDDVTDLETFVRWLEEGRFQRETGSDSPNRPSRRFNQSQEKDSAVLLSPGLFPGQSGAEVEVVYPEQPKQPDLILADERQGNYGGSSTGNFERKYVKPSSPIETPIGGGGEQEQAGPESEAKDEMPRSSISSTFDDIIDEAQESDVRDYEREKIAPNFTIGECVQASDASRSEREDDQEQPRSPVDHSSAATMCSKTQLEIDTGSDEGKELEKKPKTPIPESASSVFGEGEQVSAAESYEKKDGKAPKSLVEALSTGEFSEGQEGTVKHVEREESEKKPVEEEGASGNGHPIAEAGSQCSSTTTNPTTPSSKPLQASGASQNGLPIPLIAGGVRLVSQMSEEPENLSFADQKKKSQLKKYMNQAKEYEKQIAELERKLWVKESQLTKVNNKLSERNVQLADSEKKVADYKKEIDKLKKEIASCKKLLFDSKCLMCSYRAVAKESKESSKKRVGYALLLFNTFSDHESESQLPELEWAKPEGNFLEFVLKIVGYKVKLVFDTTEEEMYRALSEVEGEIEDDDRSVLVFFSTHGGLSLGGGGKYICDKEGKKIFDLDGVLDRHLGYCRGKPILVCVDACRGEKDHKPDDSLPNNRTIFYSCMSGYASYWSSCTGSPFASAFCGEMLDCYRKTDLSTILHRASDRVWRVTDLSYCDGDDEVQVRQVAETKSTFCKPVYLTQEAENEQATRRRHSVVPTDSAQ